MNDAFICFWSRIWKEWHEFVSDNHARVENEHEICQWNPAQWGGTGLSSC